MQHGFDITFREVIPESGMVELVALELERLRTHDGLHCSVVISRPVQEDAGFAVRVELQSRERHYAALLGQANADEPYAALRQAFVRLRAACATHGLARCDGPPSENRGPRPEPRSPRLRRALPLLAVAGPRSVNARPGGED